MENSIEEEYKKKKRTQNIVLLIVGGFVLVGILMWNLSDRLVDYDQTLVFSAKAVNLTCPQEIDELTRLDSVAAKPGRRYFYYYTLLNIEKDSMDIDVLCTTLEENLGINLRKEQMSVEEFGKNGVTINYVFNDRNADDLCTVTMKPEQYYPSKKDSLTD